MTASPDYATLQTRLGHKFRDESLLRLALTHPSVAHEQGTAVQHNQRLEFLGDAVLQLILTGELYQRFSDLGEGPLTKSRAKLVNQGSLAGHGATLGLGQFLIVSRGEDLSGGRDRPSTLADAYEAVLGALFLDGGFDVARRFVLQEFSVQLSELSGTPAMDNPKGELQELLQAHSTEAPQYLVASVAGPDHNRVYECTVHHGGVELARGQGKSKKAAESDAALAALIQLRAKTELPGQITMSFSKPAKKRSRKPAAPKTPTAASTPS